MPQATVGARALSESQGAEPGAGDPLLPADGEAFRARVLVGTQAEVACETGTGTQF